MKPVPPKGTAKGQGWILFFYSVPSKPVSNRMKVWRRLTKAGAVQLKGSVYILPYNDEHYEFLQWLVSEIAEMKGEAGFVKIEKIDTMKDPEIITLFDTQRTDDYKNIGKALDDLERRLNSTQKGGKAQNIEDISEQFAKVLRGYEEVQRVDFFSSREGQALNQRIRRTKTNLKTLSGVEQGKEEAVAITPKRVEDYHGRTWVTREKPFIDRMASAWLIRRFIDKKASFEFIDERDMDSIGRGPIVFDIRGGEFTHIGDMCTFEVLVKCFGLKDKVLKKMAEIVHDLDLKDEKYKSAEAKGLEDILIGIRKAAKDDSDALEKGMTVFEMLYVSKS
ncbi:MAG TPA: chromate resistance protein ChrB domain-containing protein [Thermodesulfovibrionales bacterium]|nr:chromate resistance protein ChrB domain-containing protein [Thermodesulfovibrionales bacterium]